MTGLSRLRPVGIAVAFTRGMNARVHRDGRRPRRRDHPLVDAVEAVRGVHRLVIDLMAVALALRCDNSASPMLVDIGRRPLEQVLLNLVFHALDRRTGAEARICLEVARIRARATPGTSPLEPRACYARLRVTDDGPALTDEDRAGLFAPGAPGKVPGLAVARTIVQDAGGRVTAEQRLEGTAISVFLPIVQPPARAPGTRQG